MILLLAVLLIVCSITLLSKAVVAGERPAMARALDALEHLSASPDELAAEAEQPFAERVLQPIHDRAVALGRRMTGADTAEAIRRRLDVAGNPREWSVDRVVSLKVIGAVALPVLALGWGALLGMGIPTIILLPAAGLLIGFFAPDIYLYNCATKRAEIIKKTLADAVDLLTISVEAGLGFDAALQQVARKTDGPLAQEFSRVLREMQLGKGRSEALRSLSERTNVDELKSFAGSMVQADSFGIPIGQVLRVQSSEMRVKRRQHAEAKAQQVPVKIMVPLIFCILPCLFIVIMGPAAISVMKQF